MSKSKSSGERYYTTLITIHGDEIEVDMPLDDLDKCQDDLMTALNSNSLYFVHSVSDDVTASFKGNLLDIIDMKKIIGRI